MVWLLLVAPRWACANDLATFQEMQAKYQSFLKEAGKPLFDNYQRKLLEIEKSAVAQRNYLLAAKVRGERKEAARLLGIALPDEPNGAPPSDPTTPTEVGGTVTLEMSAAQLGGGVGLDQSLGVLTGWTSDKCFAQWKLPQGVKPGGYEVELTYACAEGSGGKFMVREDAYFLKREIKSTGGADSFLTEICGTLRLKSCRTLLISATQSLGSGLFTLKHVRLLPSAQGG